MAGLKCAGLVLLVMATTMAIAEARTIVVGGSQNWRYGYNYTDWALKNSPFFINDKLGESVTKQLLVWISCHLDISLERAYRVSNE